MIQLISLSQKKTIHRVPNLLPTPPTPTALLSSGTILLVLAFNQDSSCFSAATNYGFCIYNIDRFWDLFRRCFIGGAASTTAYDGSGGGIGAFGMLLRFHILALIGGGPSQDYLKYKVLLGDDHQSRCIGELSFRSEVKAVGLHLDFSVVVCEFEIQCIG